jgi:hypothetical protein
MKLLKKLILSGVLLALSIAAYAGPQLYQVELIVFSHITANGLNSEQWPIIKNPGLNLSSSFGLKPLLQNTDDPAAKIDSYQVLPNFNFTLNKIGNKLIQTPGYNVVMHIAWQQTLDRPHQARWIHVFGGTGYDDEGNAVAQDMDGSATYDQAQHWQIDGLLKLDTVRFINTKYNFVFAAPTGQIQDLSTNNNFNDIDSPLLYFRLDQNRRMRSDELNYIGHPLYGVLINVTKVAQQPTDSTDSSTTTSNEAMTPDGKSDVN